MNTSLSIKTILKIALLRVVVLSIPVFTVIFIGLTAFYRTQLDYALLNFEKKQQEVVNIKEYQINSLFNMIFNDLNLIRNSDEFSEFMLSGNTENYNELAAMFVRFLKSKPEYLQLRYIDNEGSEIVRVQRLMERIFAVEKNKLQNKSERYYVKSAGMLKQGDLYISDFDLNVENGQIEYPLQPTIRIAIPVIINDRKSGSIIINYDGFRLLKMLENYEENKVYSIDLGILDLNHFIRITILDSKKSLEDSFLSKSNETEKLLKEIRNSDDSIFKYNNGSYYFNHLEIEGPFNTVIDQASGDWYLVSSYNQAEVVREIGSFYLTHPELNAVIAFLVAAFLLIISVLSFLKKSDHELLLATGYISDSSHDAVLIADRDKKVIYVNDVFEKTFGYKLKSIKGQSPQAFLNAQDETQTKLNREGIDSWAGNVWDKSVTGILIQKYLRVKRVLSSTGRPLYFIGIYSEPKLKGGLDSPEFNLVSPFLTKQSIQALSPTVDDNFSAMRQNAVIVIRFNELVFMKNQLPDNESEQMINLFTDRLITLVPHVSNFIIPSTGFVLITTRIDEDNSIETFMNQIDYSISSLRFFRGTEDSVHYLSGIALAPEHGKTCKELILNALIALEALSTLKEMRYLVFNHDIYEEIKERRIIKEEIQNAFENNEFTLVYQLQENASTRKVTGVEALLRWNNRRLGNISPAIFVPVMEETNQIKKLGKYVLNIILRECESILKYIDMDFRISINLSTQEFNDLSLVGELVQRISDSAIPVDNMCFEITETILSENLEHTNKVIELLHNKNIMVAIDDFGTGYSSLSYLKKLQSDKLKIDRAFIKDYPEHDDGTILKAIAKLATSMGIKVMVEGVETAEQLEFIKETGCDEFQGYYSSKPIPIDELIKRLKKY